MGALFGLGMTIASLSVGIVIGIARTTHDGPRPAIFAVAR